MTGTNLSVYLSSTQLRMLDAMVRKVAAAGESSATAKATRSAYVQAAIETQFCKEFPEFEERQRAVMEEISGKFVELAVEALEGKGSLQSPIDYFNQVRVTHQEAFLDELDAAHAEAEAAE